LLEAIHNLLFSSALSISILLLNIVYLFLSNTSFSSSIYRKPKSISTFKFLGLSNIVSSELLGYRDEGLLGFRLEDAYMLYHKLRFRRISRSGQVSQIEKNSADKDKRWTTNKINVDPENRINIGERIGIKIDKDRILRFKEVPEDIMQSIYSRLDKSFYDP